MSQSLRLSAMKQSQAGSAFKGNKMIKANLLSFVIFLMACSIPNAGYAPGTRGGHCVRNPPELGPRCNAGLECLGPATNDVCDIYNHDLGAIVGSDLYTPPPPPPDLASGCYDVSVVGPNDAVACPGKLGLITASDRCLQLGPTYKPCSNSSLVSLPKCQALTGYFISANFGYRPQIAGLSTCNIGGPPNTFVMWGCGLVSAGVLSDGTCSGFNKSVATDGNGWQDVNPPSVDGVQTSNPNNGVLCCKA